MKISAIVCTYNREKFLEKALESLARQTLQHSDFEVVIVNNNSTDNTPTVSENFHKKYPQIAYTYVVETNQGLSYARNRGIKEAKTDIVTFIDDDAQLDEKFLEVVVDFMEKHPEVVAVGGKILLDYESKPPKWVSKYIESLFGYFVYSDKIEPFNKKLYPRGSNMTFKKDVFDKVGFFDVNLGRTGKNMGGNEEKDIFHRIYEKNMLVYHLPEAVVYHAVPDFRTTKDFIKKQATGIGTSERYRTITASKSQYYKAILRELMKWGATGILTFFYFATLQPAKGIMLVKFRYWISKGLMTKHHKSN